MQNPFSPVSRYQFKPTILLPFGLLLILVGVKTTIRYGFDGFKAKESAIVAVTTNKDTVIHNLYKEDVGDTIVSTFTTSGLAITVAPLTSTLVNSMAVCVVNGSMATISSQCGTNFRYVVTGN